MQKSRRSLSYRFIYTFCAIKMHKNKRTSTAIFATHMLTAEKLCTKRISLHFVTYSPHRKHQTINWLHVLQRTEKFGLGEVFKKCV